MSFELSSKLVFDNEKKATSEPEINAEKINKTKRAKMPEANGQFIDIINNKLEGSESNYMKFSST